jgi:hypothetical protein
MGSVEQKPPHRSRKQNLYLGTDFKSKGRTVPTHLSGQNRKEEDPDQKKMYKTKMSSNDAAQGHIAKQCSGSMTFWCGSGSCYFRH